MENRAYPESTLISPQINWAKWEAREPDDPYTAYEPKPSSEEHHPTGENLEAWQYIAGEFGKLDARENKACKEDMDTLIMVAGLFSAVFTAFDCEFYKQLQPAPEATSAYILAKIAHQINETLISADVVEELRPHSPSQSISSTVLINALWFSGLVLSLMTAAGAMLIKQWLQDYSATKVHLPHHYCRVRFFRHNAFTRYRVYEIATCLPYILQLALTFFLIGLACFLWLLNPSVFGMVMIFLVIWLALYLSAIVLSMMDPTCPYNLPVMGNLHYFIRRLILKFKVMVYRRLGRQIPRSVFSSCNDYGDNRARTDPSYDALVLVSAYSTFQTHAINEQVMKAFRTVHLGRIDRTALFKYLFSIPCSVRLSPDLLRLLQPAVKTMIVGFFPTMPSHMRPVGVDIFVSAIKFAFASPGVCRSRMLRVLENICELQDEHLTPQLIERVLSGVAPCFDFYKKNRWAFSNTSARVIDVFTNFISLHLSNAPSCYGKFICGADRDDWAVNWIGFYLFLLVHSRRRLNAESLGKAHRVLILFSDLLQFVINKYRKYSQNAITRANLCVELVEEFQQEYSTAVDPALITGLKHISSFKPPALEEDEGANGDAAQAKSPTSSSDQPSGQMIQQNKDASNSTAGKESAVSMQSVVQPADTSDTPAPMGSLDKQG